MTTPSGFIISDRHGIIHGIGLSVGGAWLDAESTLAAVGLEVRDQSLVAIPATHRLMTGLGRWEVRDGVAASVDEPAA